MKFKIKDLEGFQNEVFGADDLIKYFPELMTGIELQIIDGCYYVMKNGKMINDTSFFTLDEMQFMECCE